MCSGGALEAVPRGPFDVAVSATSEDGALADFIKDKLEGASLSVYCKPSKAVSDAKVFGKVLVDTKCLVSVVSKTSVKLNHLFAQVSLAYICNKPIVVVSVLPKSDVLDHFELHCGMKLTLEYLYWCVFQNEGEREDNGRQFVQLVQEQLSKPAIEPTLETVTVHGAGARCRPRINTKLRYSPGPCSFEETEDPSKDNYFDHNFPGESEVPWSQFWEAFLSNYKTHLTGLLDGDHVLGDFLKSNVFAGKEMVSRDHFMAICGDSHDRNAFWSVVSQIAAEMFNMHEVFNVHSTVRLTAIEKLSQFQNPAMVDALIHLINDDDPNVRAVAAVSLGRTRNESNNIVDHLIRLLKDKDRIVRQAACLSLGKLKAEKAVPQLGFVWRNDVISVVRSAARTALERMRNESAQQLLEVTKVLEEEIIDMEGEPAIV
jgi:hypothetical protein